MFREAGPLVAFVFASIVIDVAPENVPQSRSDAARQIVRRNRHRASRVCAADGHVDSPRRSVLRRNHRACRKRHRKRPGRRPRPTTARSGATANLSPGPKPPARPQASRSRESVKASCHTHPRRTLPSGLHHRPELSYLVRCSRGPWS